MYEASVREHFSGVPVFGLADLAQIIQNRDYAKKYLQKMVRQGRIRKIKRDSYTLHDDPFLISTFLVKPSYVSSVSALSYHHIITQIPNEVFCFTTKRATRVDFVSRISFFHTKHFFGFVPERYMDFSIPVATPEKAIIDSIHTVPLSVFEEAFDMIDIDVMVDYLKRIKKSSIAKRIGYMAERRGFPVYERVRELLNNRYILLDPLAKRRGIRDKKWRLIVNG